MECSTIQDTGYKIHQKQCWIHLRDGNISTQDKMQNIRYKINNARYKIHDTGTHATGCRI